MDSWIGSLAYTANFRPVRDSKQQQQEQERDVYTGRMTAKVGCLLASTGSGTPMHIHTCACIYMNTCVHIHTMLVTKFKYQ